MPHQIERKFAFGPSALNDLARRGWGIEANTEEQVQCIKTKLAQRIMEYAAEGEHDVEHLKEFGLQGFPHLCAHRIGQQQRPS
jgi:SPX domain protein involved in polyphosphate accumulation